jgi:hypothetical protein
MTGDELAAPDCGGTELTNCEVTDGSLGLGGETVSIHKPPSRYAFWLWEQQERRNSNGTYSNLATVPVGDVPMPLIPYPLEEKGVPQCITDPFFIGNQDRRLLYLAVVDCEKYRDELSSGHRIVPIKETLEVFLTEAADSNASGGPGDLGAIYVEPIRGLAIEGQDAVVMREIIQLY